MLAYHITWAPAEARTRDLPLRGERSTTELQAPLKSLVVWVPTCNYITCTSLIRSILNMTLVQLIVLHISWNTLHDDYHDLEVLAIVKVLASQTTTDLRSTFFME